MKPRKHLTLFFQASLVWLMFWLAGLPSNYFQDYSAVTMGIASVLISVATSLAAIWLLRSGRDETRMSRAFWLSVYYTIPFATYDFLYCGWYLGYGSSYISMYWYLSIFYITPWLTFLPTAMLLRGGQARISV